MANLLTIACALVLAHSRFLAPPAEDLSPEAQIAALNAEIANAESDLRSAKKDAGVSEAPAFVRHCTEAQRSKLDGAGVKAGPVVKKTAPVVAKKDKAWDEFEERMKASNRKSLIENEEFLMGLLLMHQTSGDWTPEQTLDAVCALAGDSPLITKLYKHHSATEPMSLQLARLMDAERLEMSPTKAPPLELGSAAVNGLLASAGMGRVAKKAASRKMFIQLADTDMNRDCPYCAAQCVDKCHTAGKPYVQCLTDCADAGK